MSKITNPSPVENVSAEANALVEVNALSSDALARRRMLLKSVGKGSAVVVTLASRPAYAWHCTTPSAWGSETMNPTTSLTRGSKAHPLYIDETWTVTNWSNNSTRAGLGNPWDVLFVKFPNLKTACKTAWSADGKKKAKFQYATVQNLVDYVTGFAKPSDASAQANVATLMGSGFGHTQYTLAAQLNFILLGGVSGNEMNKCVSQADLRQMATGTYKPSNEATWTLSRIKDYLFNNYLTRD